jgi:enoyl-CoA hydratase/carnithine racemase
MALVEYELRDRIAIITMNRPERLNAWNQEFAQAMFDAWTRFNEDEAAQVGIITGAGRAFSAGADMRERIEQADPRQTPQRPMAQVEKPTIAAINGFAYGLGFFTAARADLRVAAESAMFQISEVNRGQVAGWNTHYTMGLTPAVATELGVGMALTAQRLYEGGFLNKVVPLDQLIPSAMEMAEKLLEIPPLALRSNLRLMRMLHPTVPEEVTTLARELAQQASQSADRIEAIRAFTEKRKPVYTGR